MAILAPVHGYCAILPVPPDWRAMGSTRGFSGLHVDGLDAAIGPQRNSLRPNSARFSFGRSAQKRAEQQGETPGPACYECPSVQHSVSAFIGTAVSESHVKPYPYPDLVDEPEAAIPDSSEYRFDAPPRQVFGTAERGGKVSDFEYIRACPDHMYGDTGPGFVYTPDDRRTRPRSAPSYSMRKRQDSMARPRTPAQVAPNSYAGANEEAIGVQRNSRRRTASASSFGRAERFPTQKRAEGGLSAECSSVRSAFDRRSGRSGGYGFGTSTRDGSSRTCVSRGAGDRPASANLCRPKLPHPSVAPRQEIIRFNSNME